MEINTWILIIGGVAVLFFGYFFGLIEGGARDIRSARTRKKRKKKPGKFQRNPQQPRR